MAILSILRDLPDPRVERTRMHKLEDILCLAICAILCGVESFEDMEVFGEAKQEWFQTFLELPHGIPSHDTFNRLFAALDAHKFMEAFMRWTQSMRSAVEQEIVAMDGKALRRAIDAGQNPKPSSMRGRPRAVWFWASEGWMRKATRSKPCPSCFACWN